MHVSVLTWIITIVVMLAVLVVDAVLMARHPHVPSVRECVACIGVYVGLAAVFCGVTNCPLASTLLAVELFGADGLLYFALACCLSYMLSGYQGLYSSQTILYSKLKARFINVHTNAYHASESKD